MESTTNQVRDAIRQLPIQQRAVAIALKKIFDQIKQLTKKQQQQIDANHLSFISKFKVLQKKASDIIQGTNLLKEQDLDNTIQFFTPQESKQKSQLLKQKNKIQNYWYNVFQNSELGSDINQQQQQILKSITDIQSNITTSQIEVTFVVQKNSFIEKGVYNRRLILDNGMPISFEGPQPKWISTEQKKEGLLTSYIFVNTKNSEFLPVLFSSIGTIINELVPYSLQYYLGINEQDGQGEQQDEQADQNEDEGEDQ